MWRFIGDDRHGQETSYAFGREVAHRISKGEEDIGRFEAEEGRVQEGKRQGQQE